MDVGDERQKLKMSPLYLIMDFQVYDIDTNQIAVRKGKKKQVSVVGNKMLSILHVLSLRCPQDVKEILY